MKTFTLYLKIFAFLLLIWIFPFLYNYDSSKSLINKDTLQKKIRLKHERMLAEGDISEKNSSYIKELVEHYTSGEVMMSHVDLVYLMGMYIKCYIANIVSNIEDNVLLNEENKMRYKCSDKILNAYRNNISAERALDILSLTD
ncbi:fam-g protein [Plasmodium gallinaceum]|uniref:Fam-g protein n=1 Tax=Plasmodium gallinaceum TaxID=5849 RepID=A0A1J1H0F2_PLAGA|nr:fam-g protein [Plasmodium gallinaceum]CRG98225.1 fam-g protein [Plasmodium gallinaceum]